MAINLNEALEELNACRELDVDEKVANALFKVGIAYLERGRLDQAQESLEEAYYHCNKVDNHAGRAEVCVRLAELDLARGELVRAEARLLEADKAFAETGDLSGGFKVNERLARVYQAAGRPDAALECLEEAEDFAREHNDELSLLLLAQYKAPVLRAMGRNEDSIAAYCRMGALAEKLGEPQRVALALVGVGTLHCQGGDHKRGLAELAQARQAFINIGLGGRAREVEREINLFKESMDREESK